MKRLIRMPAKAIAGLALPMITLCVAGPTQAQDDRWFKVELLVFSQVSASGATSEIWDPAPELSYPDEFRFLTDPLAIETNLACYNATGVMDEFGRQILTINPPTSEDGPDDEPVDETASGMELTPEPEPLPLTPTPFVKLAGSEMEFRGKAAYMRRTGRYQILFHESWVQPVESEADTLPIILDRSGDTRGWPDLQGSIKLYLSRYLHIETNLWLNTMGQYLPEYWRIPAAPLGPQSLIVENPDLPEVLIETGAAAALEELPKTVEIRGENTGDVPDPIAMAPVYPWHHAVVLKQKRRMRSTEVHYIDHPMLGVVVLVSPLTDEELEEMAAVEFAPEPEDVIAEEAQAL